MARRIVRKKGNVTDDQAVPMTLYGPPDGLNFLRDWSEDYLKACLMTDVGKKRQNNEDSCILCAPEDSRLTKERGFLFAVADGMGGASAGERASRVALQTLVRHYYLEPVLPVPDLLREAIEKANEIIFQESETNPHYAGMGTTVSACVVVGDWVYAAQVGDSRLYLLRERSGIHQITNDHSLVAEQVRSGLITEEEARNHTLRNLITRAVGIKDDVSVDLYCFHVRRGDTLLLCSDGVCGLVADAAIAEALSSGDLVAGTKDLIGQALDNGGTDNATAVTVRFMDAPPAIPKQEGAEEVRISGGGFLRRLLRLFT